MKPKLLIAYVILITVPLAVLGWLGVRTMASEQERIDRQFERLTEERLLAYADEIEDMLSEWARQWETVQWNPGDPDSVRDVVRNDGRIRQFFALNADGSVVFPVFDDTATQAERQFLIDTEDIWESGSIHPNQMVRREGDVSRESGSTGIVADSPQRRWHTWYWQEGLQLMVWWLAADGGVYGIQLHRVRAQAEIIGILPDTPQNIVFGNLGVRMRNEAGEVVYQWGPVSESADASHIASVPLRAPLQTWTLEGHLTAARNDSELFMLGLGLSAVAGLFLLVGIYVYRENTRELREAEQRVNFVNHVSHELKTPLTNIRMYAELLQDDLPEDEKVSGRLSVILNESQRLSRLITNVLTFNRKQHSKLQLHASPTDPDRLVRGVIGHFQQSFAEKNIEIEFRPGVLSEVRIDADVIEQIVGNLLSNVDKYAGGDQKVTVATALVDGDLEIHVQDQGPGIPMSHEEAVFEPFERIRSDLTEGVAGTGIGLSIARDLARLHGGDLEIIPEERGAHFCLYVRLQENAS